MGNVAPCAKAEHGRSGVHSKPELQKETPSIQMDMPCKQMGRYEILRNLGLGASSTVKLGQDEAGKQYALKIFHDLEDNRSASRLAQFEIDILTKMHHPNILQLFEVVNHVQYCSERQHRKVETTMMVLELASHGDLFDLLLNCGTFSEEIARTFANQLLSAIDYLHEHGICHRDLKLENLLLTEDYQIKLADFGLACDVNIPRRLTCSDSSSNLMHTRVGTSEFMAPELFSCNAAYDPKAADIWSFGVCLFAFLTGHPPFSHPDASDWWFQQISSGHYDGFWSSQKPSEFSDEFQDLLNHIFVVDPSQRLSITQIKAHAWLQLPILSTEEMTAQLNQSKKSQKS